MLEFIRGPEPCRGVDTSRAVTVERREGPTEGTAAGLANANQPREDWSPFTAFPSSPAHSMQTRAGLFVAIMLALVSWPTAAQGWLNGGFETASDVSDRFPWGWADWPNEGHGYDARRVCNQLGAAPVAAVGSCALRIRSVGAGATSTWSKDTAVLARRLSPLGIAGRVLTMRVRARMEPGSKGTTRALGLV